MTQEAPTPVVSRGARTAPAVDVAGIAPTVVIRPSRGWRAVNLRELWEYRELLYFLVWSDLKVRYKQTVLGVLWAILQPILITGVFYLTFTIFARLPTAGIPPIVFYLSGLIPWTLFSRGLVDASMTLIQNLSLVTKVYFPRLLLPVAEVLSALVDVGLTLIVLAALMVYFGMIPPLQILALPVFLVIALMASLGISFWLAPFNAKYRDVRYTVPLLTQLWMLATPIAYLISFVPASWLWLYSLNPMVIVVQGFRWALFPGWPLDFGLSSLLSLAVVILVFVSGLFYFRRAERTFADVV